MKRLLVSSIAIAGACFVAAGANAGLVQREPVTSNENLGIHGGNLTSARWSGDTKQYVGCNVTATRAFGESATPLTWRAIITHASRKTTSSSG